MNLPANYPAPAFTHLTSAVGETRRTGKSANSGSFGERFDEYEPCWEGFAHPPAENRACQNETRPFAPLWNGPVLRCAFVAQVLGQAVADRRTWAPHLAAQFYRRSVSRVPAALLLDISI